MAGSAFKRVLVCSILVQFLFGVSALCQEQQYASLGDLKLQSGEVIRNCRIGYRTYGKLNANRSNAILWPTWFLGHSEDVASSIGPDKLLDPGKYFVVVVDALGNGVSSSPSNSPKQPGMKFPKFTIQDMVDSQYRLLTEKLGIQHLHAVLGESMGGFQAFEWMVRYPDFMDITIPIEGTPRVQTSDILWASVEAESIRNDKEWNDGNYSHQPKLLAAKYTHMFVMWTPNQLDSHILPQDTDKFLAQGASFGGNFDANDWLYQLGAVLSMNIYDGRSMKDTAKLVKSKVLIVSSEQDLAVNPSEAVRFAQALGVKPVILTGPCGHMAAGCDAATLTPVIQNFLK